MDVNAIIIEHINSIITMMSLKTFGLCASAGLTAYGIMQTRWFTKKMDRFVVNIAGGKIYDLAKEPRDEILDLCIKNQNKYLFRRATDTDEDKKKREEWWKVDKHKYIYVYPSEFDSDYKDDKNMVFLFNYNDSPNASFVNKVVTAFIISHLGEKQRTFDPTITGIAIFDAHRKLVYLNYEPEPEGNPEM